MSRKNRDAWRPPFNFAEDAKGKAEEAYVTEEQLADAEEANRRAVEHAEAQTPAGQLKALLEDVGERFGQEPTGDNDLSDEDKKALDEITGKAPVEHSESVVGINTAPPRLMETALADHE